MKPVYTWRQRLQHLLCFLLGCARPDHAFCNRCGHNYMTKRYWWLWRNR